MRITHGATRVAAYRPRWSRPACPRGADAEKADSPTQHPTTVSELKYQGAPSPAAPVLVTPGAPNMTMADSIAHRIYFQRCAGCHACCAAPVNRARRTSHGRRLPNT